MKNKLAMMAGAVLVAVVSVGAAMSVDAATGPWDADVAEFPRLADEQGDSARIMRAAEAAGEGGVVWIPKGEYAIDAMLDVTNGCSLKLHPSAHLKAVEKMPFVLRWNYHGRKPGGMNLFLRGGDFDGAGLAGCVNVIGRWKFTVADATFRNGLGAGLQFGTSENRNGCEMIVDNIYCICDRPGMAGNVGLLTYVGDSHFTDVVVVDYTVGIRDERWSNRFTRCHVWGGPVKKPGTKDPEYLPHSIAFDLQGDDAVLEDSYADTAMIGFNVGKDARIFNSGYFNNWDFKMDNPIVFRHTGGKLIVTGGRFSKNSPNARLYIRGESIGPVIWRDNNVLNFTEEEMKFLNDELKNNCEKINAEKNDVKLAG